MKKVLAVVAVVCVIFAAGTALAAPHKGNAGAHHRMPPRMERPMPAGHEAPRPPHHGRRHHIFTPDMPKEIREKAAELAKLRVDLEEAMTSRPLNKEKALDVHKKIQAVRQEIEMWRFTKRLERIEEMQKKGLPPEPAAPAPEVPENEATE